MSAAQMQLLTAKMAPKDLSSLKKQLLRPGFVQEWNNLDALAAGFAKVLLAKENQVPSAGFKCFTSHDPEAVLWLGFTSKDNGVKERYNKFLKEWPEMRQKVPYALMQEMRIRPELPNYNEIVQSVFLGLIDGKLTTPEEMRAFLEPYSPPAPPPQVTIKRTRGKRGEAKVKDFDEEEEEAEEGVEGDEELDEMGGDEDEIGLGMDLPKVDLEHEEGDDELEGAVASVGDDDDAGDDSDEDEEQSEEEAPARHQGKGKAKPVAAASRHASAEKAPVKQGKHPVKPDAKHAPAHKPAVPHSKAPAKPAAKHAPPKKVDAHAHKPAKHVAAKPEKKHPAKSTAKPAAKSAPAKSHGSHPAPARNSTPAKGHKHVKPVHKPATKKR
jgi:hypothetical protein